MRISRYRIPEILGDIILVAGAFTLAFFLRFDFTIPLDQFKLLKTFILPILGAKLIIFYFSGLYRRIWRYASVRDFFTIIWASIGSNSLVLKDVEAWSIDVGSPYKKIGDRPKVVVPDI